ncbi:MAG TPA: aspartate aminotransferase family protein [Ilumatobacteraceae bacterium]|nr:aspartate aminotransferase family protein [Ilumatobacteraceae bacterium]
MSDLSELARRHLWMHFTRLGAYTDHEVPVIARGEGCYVWDQHGKRYLDGLSGLFTVQVGHGRTELGEAAARQAQTLGYFPVWSFAHEPAIELAARLAALAPGDLNRVFLTPSGGEAIDTAIKLARQYFKLIGQPSRTKVISRFLAYHGTSIGALSVTGVPSIKTAFEPLMPGAIKVQTPYRYRCADCQHLGACTLRCADDVALRIEMEGPDSVAAVFMEPLQNTGGAFAPPEGYWERIREICDHYGVLLVSDEVICAFGRLGHMFGSDRYGYQPDLITFAKGVTSGYAPLGGVLVSDRIAQPFLDDPNLFLHGQTFGAHPVCCAVANANLDILEREDLCANVLAHEDLFTKLLDGLRDIPLVGDVRGDGYFRAIELVSDQATKGAFTPEASEWLLRGHLSPRLYEAGLICRADDRAEPVITLAPPLIAGEAELTFIVDTLRTVLCEASTEFAARRD